MLSNSLIELDRAHLIHPVSSYRGHEALGVRVLKSAKGATLTDVSGHELLDGFVGVPGPNRKYSRGRISRPSPSPRTRCVAGFRRDRLNIRGAV